MRESESESGSCNRRKREIIPVHEIGGRRTDEKPSSKKRAAKDLSQEELAQKVGVSRQTISAIEKGDYNPTIRLCVKICRTLDRTLDDLFWEET